MQDWTLRGEYVGNWSAYDFNSGDQVALGVDRDWRERIADIG